MLDDAHLDDMTTVLTRALSLSPEQAATARDALESAWKDKIAVVCGISDAIAICRLRFDKTITPSQARAVLQQVEAGYDAFPALSAEAVADAIQQLGFDL
jgi:hypothetical protein